MANTIIPGSTGYNVRFGTADEYNTKKRNSLLQENDFYIVEYEDSYRAYLGYDNLNKKIIPYDSTENKPSDLIEDTIYICKSPLSVFYYNGTDEITMVPRINSSISADESGNDNNLCTIGAIKKFVKTKEITIDPVTKHWMIGEEDTNVVAEGNANAIIEIDPDTKHWIISEEDTGVVAEGISPHIDPETNNWFIGETDTGIKAIVEAEDIDYSKLTNLPTIEGTEITGDLSLEDLNITSGDHVSKGLNTDEGVHGIRFKNGFFQQYNPDNSQWENLYLSVDLLPDLKRTNFYYTPTGNSVSITWTDAADVTDGYGRKNVWKSITLVRNADHFPEHENDGTSLVKTSKRNSHETTPLIDRNLDGGKKYYYTAFVNSSNGIVNPKLNQFSVETLSYPLDGLSNITFDTTYNVVHLSWTDPEDTDNAIWERTVWVRKQNSNPTNINDGVIVLTEIGEKNQYKEIPFNDVISNTSGNWYYRGFVVSSDNVITALSQDGFVVNVRKPPIYGIQIDKNEPDPVNRVTYTDDAIGFIEAATDNTVITEGSSLGFFWNGWKNNDLIHIDPPHLVNSQNEYLYPDPSNPGYDYAGEALPEDLSDYDWYITLPVYGIKYTETDEYINIQITPSPYMEDEGFTYEAYKHSNSVHDYHPIEISVFETSIDTSISGNTRYRSIKGIDTTSNLIAKADWNGLSYANTYNMYEAMSSHRVEGKVGTYDGIINIYQLSLIYSILMIIFKTTNIESIFGVESYTGNTGSISDDTTWFYSGKTGHSKILGIENLVGNGSRLFTGVELNNMENQKDVIILRRHIDSNEAVIIDSENLIIGGNKFSGTAENNNLGSLYTSGHVKNFMVLNDSVLFPHDWSGSSETYHGQEVNMCKTDFEIISDPLLPVYPNYIQLMGMNLWIEIEANYASRTTRIGNLIRY